ncbi:MAG: hypothetical protein ABSF70_08805 [Terracidiphilus sp.]
MRKTLRIAVAAAVLLLVAPIPSFANDAPVGTDPDPIGMSVSSISIIVSTVLAVLGL